MNPRVEVIGVVLRVALRAIGWAAAVVVASLVMFLAGFVGVNPFGSSLGFWPTVMHQGFALAGLGWVFLPIVYRWRWAAVLIAVAWVLLALVWVSAVHRGYRLEPALSAALAWFFATLAIAAVLFEDPPSYLRRQDPADDVQS